MKIHQKLILSIAFLAVAPASSLANTDSEAALKAQIEKLTEDSKTQAKAIHDLQSKSENQTPSDTTIGGYGEIAYNRYGSDNSRSIVDLKRFVLMFGHRFNDKLSFNSEVEWEHAVSSADDKGEAEIEQAYLNYQMGHGLNLKAGLFLMPFGFLNQSHEPPVFFGVERNEVETRIIPSTWREGGIGLYGDTDIGLDWDVGITTGFDVAKFDDSGAPLRAIHQELQFAKANDPAFYGALNYRGVPGLIIGDAIFTGNAGQGNADFKADSTQPDFSGINGRVTLWDMHTRYQNKGWDLQALYAHGSIANADQLDSVIDAYNTANSKSNALVPSSFYGWFVQAAYTVFEKGDHSITPFVRYERFDTQSTMPSSFSADSVNADKVATFGFSYKPHQQVVVKMDFQKFMQHSDNNRFNIGLGYMF